MTGPIELMADWQQALICVGLFVLMVALQCLPQRKPPRRDQQEQLARQTVDTSEPPSWWEELDWNR